MSDKNIPNDSHPYLHVILTCDLLIQLMDRLSNTKYYNRLLKHRAKLLLPELEKVVNEELGALLEKVENRGITGLLKSQEDLVQELALHYTHDFPIITGLLKLYRENPEDVLRKLDIVIVNDETLAT